MKDKRNRHGAVGKLSLEQNLPPLLLSCEISGALHLAQPGLTAGRQAKYRFIPYNQNIWRRENLVNRLNLPVGENLNWRQSMFELHDFMDAMMDTYAGGKPLPRTEV